MFLGSILLGSSLALLYDLIRPWRRLGGRVWNGLLDTLLTLTAAATLFFFFMAGEGELRLFILLGALGGAVLFFCLLSRPLRPLWDFWVQFLLIPMTIAKKFLKIGGKFCKKLFSFCKKWFTIISTYMRPQAQSVQEGEGEMAQDKQTAKKRPSTKLTGLLLVIFLFGIGFQIYGMYGQIQEAKAEEAVYAQRLTQLQETNARLMEEIDNSDDPALIEEIARNDLGMVGPGEKIFRFGN